MNNKNLPMNKKKVIMNNKEKATSRSDKKFSRKFEEEVLKTIMDYNLLKKGEKIIVAISGGKDSAVVLHLLVKFGYNPQAMILDLEIGSHSKKNLDNVKILCKKLDVKLHVISHKKEVGRSVCYMRSVLAEKERLISVQATKKLSDTTIDASCTRVLDITDDVIHFDPPDNDIWAVLIFVETATQGVIRGIHFGEDDNESGAPPATDLLNPDAIAKFIRITYDAYYNRLGEYFGKTISAIFTDEPNLLGKRAVKGLKPWTGEFLDWFLTHGGSEIDLPLLWFDGGKDAEKAGRCYDKAVHSKLESSYYRPISEWCTAHGIAFTGHPHGSEDIGSLVHFDIPGQDLVLRWVAPEDGKALESPHSTLAKCASDAARHAGKRRNLVECFGCCGHLGMGWSLTGSDMKWYTDWLFVRGINWLSPHAFYYSIRGPRRSGERPPDVGPNNIWWPYYGTVAAYMKRLSWLMTDSVNDAQVAVICEDIQLPWEIAKPLYQSQIEFNYLTDEEFVSPRCQLSHNTIEIQNQRYRAVLVENPILISETVRAKLQVFIDVGGLVVVYNQAGESPDLPGACEVHAFEDIPGLLRGRLGLDVVMNPPNPDLRVSHVTKGKLHLYLLVNEGESAIDGTLALDYTGKVEQWDAWRGSIREGIVQPMEDGGAMVIPLHLGYRESLILCIDPHQPPSWGPPETVATPSSIKILDGEWTVRGALPESQSISQLTSWTNWPDMAHFSGTVTYEHIVDIDRLSDYRYLLDLGAVHELVHININTRDAGFRMWAPYKFDVTPYLRDGKNQIQIEVTNSLANKMDGEEMPSGMLGPVSLQVFGPGIGVKK